MIRTTDDSRLREGELIAAVRDFMRELHPQRADTVDISPSSRIERELGIDSLGRTELILRIERAFRVRLSAQIVGEADTIGDLINALEYAGARPGKPRLVQATSSLPPVPAATEAKTLVEVLDWHVAQHPDRLHLTILQDDTTALGTMTYAELAEAARAVAAGLIRRDVEPGDRVALMLPTSLDFFSAFFGILHAQAVPVPIYPPMRLAQIEDHLRRQAGILRNAGARILVTTPEGQVPATLLRGQVESLSRVESVASLSTEPTMRLPPVTDARSTALIQYTSGSTGDPKGVVLSHANLLANVRAMGVAVQANSTDVFVSWLPLYHDMGLIGAWLGCLHFGAPLYVMSPLSFLVRPESWLWAMHRFRATLSASPNFGFEFCLTKIADADLAGLDLSSLRMVANGAEPVSARTLNRFVENFERHGFKPGAMAPVYGLAENTVGLAFPPPGRSPVIDLVDRAALTNRGVAMSASPDDPNPLEIVACGHPLPGHEIRIVDGAGFELGERQEGRLEFRGPSATSGYFRDDAKTRALVRDDWLDSGDRAYIASGDVYITGRAKDIIIRAGRQIYPQEIEEAVAGIPGVRKGGVVVFGATHQSTGTERVVVVAETRETNETARERLQERAREVATDIAGTPPDDIVLAPQRTVPKTSSGKIRRSAAKQLYESGTIGAPQRSLWWQVLRLSLAGVGPQTRRLCWLVAGILYAGWWWTVVGCGFLFAWLAVMVLPQLRGRWTAARVIARVVLAVLGVTVTASGIERIPRRKAMLVFNHSSYMDAAVLAAVLPGEPAFVAKRELAEQMFAGSFLRKFGSLFVERYDVAGSLADAESLTRVARQGRILVFFPEGTFTRRPGLSAFYLGAFRIAADADLPVLPGIIRGTRSMLRGGQWFPRWTSVAIEIAAPVIPSGTDFASVLRLRDAAREAILARCGEPDLGGVAKPTPREAGA